MNKLAGLMQAVLGDSWKKGSSLMVGLAVIVFAEQFGLVHPSIADSQQVWVTVARIMAASLVVLGYCLGQGRADQGKGAALVTNGKKPKTDE